MGLCLGAGVGGLYVGIRGGGAFEALAESTALGTFGDFEWEILYYQIRAVKITPYSTTEEFQRSWSSVSENITMVKGTREDLRGLASKGYSIMVVFETEVIYVYDSANGKIYYWSPIA